MRLISEMNPRYPIDFLPGWYDPSIFHRAVKGLESLPEGGERCFICYRLRMEEAAKLAAAGGYDYFTKNTVSGTCRPILKRKMAICGLYSCRRNTSCTGRISAAVSIRRHSVSGKKDRQASEKGAAQWHSFGAEDSQNSRMIL